MKEKILSIASIITSFFASICCIGIPLISILGLGSIGLTFIPAITAYRNTFIILTVLMLGLAYYFMFKNKNTAKHTQIIIWISTVISVGSIIYTIFRES